ncbi:(Fe-S)-binding protein [Streptomyces sp. NPDC050416]|uniref:(Fe-S)-binding protein n=1 Tax=Streptomyces sp. NPDC050416 TaxID=3365611 RepID=UPI00378F9DC8
MRVLEAAGFRVAVPAGPVCCGLTWISTGQLARAQKVLRRTLDTLRPHLDAGTPVIALEPSCTGVFRADAPELMPADPDVRRLAGQVRTFAEQLVHHAPDGWRPPRPARRATVQTHCHQHAITKFDADRELMRRARPDADVLDEGCCGLAGNFGFEHGHHEVSMAAAEQGVLPAVRGAAPGSLLLVDGFGCRTQIDQGDTGRRALHLAEVTGPRHGGHPPVRASGTPGRASRPALPHGPVDGHRRRHRPRGDRRGGGRPGRPAVAAARVVTPCRSRYSLQGYRHAPYRHSYAWSGTGSPRCRVAAVAARIYLGDTA